MKRIGIIVMAFVSCLTLLSFQYAGGRKEPLGSLWKAYDKADGDDLIETQAEILAQIKSVALKERSSWDYLEACSRYADVRSRRNWKQRDSLTEAAARELRAYGHPLLEMMFAMDHGAPADSLKSMIMRGGHEMKGAYSPVLYGKSRLFRGCTDRFREMLLSDIDDDYEFALWLVLENRGYMSEWVCEVLQEYVGKDYPSSQYLDLQAAMRVRDDSERISALKMMLSDEAAGDMRLLAEDRLFREEFIMLDGKGTSEEYKAFHERVAEFRTRLGRLRGNAAAVGEMCTETESVMNLMESSSVSSSVYGGKASVLFRNVDKVRLKLEADKDGRVMYDTVVCNPEKSFYRHDTVYVSLPPLDDGSYVMSISGGKDVYVNVPYRKKTISLAKRISADGPAIYAADFMTGEPLEKADLTLYKGDRKVAEVHDFVFDGFTDLPADVTGGLDDSRHWLECRMTGPDGRTRSSLMMSLNRDDFSVYQESGTEISAVIMKDRAAFMPGDTVNFKAVLYERHPDGTMKTLPEGVAVTAELHGPQRKGQEQQMPLFTNEFGAVAGCFEVGVGDRNGSWTLTVMSGGKTVGSTSLTVDEFVLPSYDVSFDRIPKHMPGDTVAVSGRVIDYSGHGAHGLSASAYVFLDSRLMPEIPVDIAPDGTFEVKCVTEDNDGASVYCRIVLKLVDSTGETLEFECASFLSTAIYLDASLLNGDDGRFDAVADNGVPKVGMSGDDTVEILCRSDLGEGYPLDYALRRGGSHVCSGSVSSGDTLRLDFSGLRQGLYELELKAFKESDSGRRSTASRKWTLMYLPYDADVLEAGISDMVRFGAEDGDISVQVGSGDGPLWALAELSDDRGRVLMSGKIYAGGAAGEEGSLVSACFPYSDSYPDAVCLNVFYFKAGQGHTVSHVFRRKTDDGVLPLKFTSFQDISRPGQEYVCSLQTAPDAEILASVFDVSSEQVRRNVWNEVRKDTYVRNVRIYSLSGRDGDGYHYAGGDAAIGYGSVRMNSKAAGTADYVSVEEETEAVAFESLADQSSDAGGRIRSDFAATLAFEPFLKPSQDGELSFSFRTSDKLSTFAVSLFAHDKDMNNNSLRKNMIVSLPVKLSVLPPQFLYSGDRYVLNASVSNMLQDAVSGTVRMEIYEGREHVGRVACMVSEKAIETDAGKVSSVSFEIPVPEASDTLGIKLIFDGGSFSDAVFVPVPVYRAAQVLTESHSAVLMHGMQEDALMEQLKDSFVNVSSVGAEYREIRVADMLRESLPLVREADGKDVISLSEAMYVNLLAAGILVSEDGSVREYAEAAMEMAAGILQCANADGGFGWFEGMRSSPVVTAVVLKRYAGLRDRGLDDVVSDELGEDVLDDFDDAVIDAVKYLDNVFFSDPGRPSWFGGISLQQYLDVRSSYAGVRFDKGSVVAMDAGRYKEFRKAVRSYLVPRRGGSRTDGSVPEKARMLRILSALGGSRAGRELADDFGVGGYAGKRLRNSMKKELESLKEYAVKHPAGGIHYPDAALPWAGLLESEAYVHAMICGLFDELASDPELGEGLAELADGIRLWLMLQKETLHWTADPGFIDALAAVYDGIDAVKDVRVMALSKRYVIPFDEVRSVGNGFRVSVEYYRECADAGRVRISDGDTLETGEKIVAVYSVWSAENRSFVCLSAPRPACLRPVSQLSGWNGGYLRPVSYRNSEVNPYAYKEVRADRTLYWIDVCPEENSVLEEELHVTQEGVFARPAVEVESFYAPHYRANGTAASIAASSS